MTADVTLLDHLQEAGYDPNDAATGDWYRGDWYDLTIPGTGTVRVCVYPRDNNRVEVYYLDPAGISQWEAKLSHATPDPVVLATIEAAEWQLAYACGGPVTPAQAERAR